MKASFETFCGAVVFGAGFHVGWVVIAFIVSVVARSFGYDSPVPIR